MRFVGQASLAHPDAGVEPVSSWFTRLPGVAAHHLDPQPDGATDLVLTLATPRAVALRLTLVAQPDGYAFDLVEGDASTVRGHLRWAEGTLHLTVELRFPITVPGPLLAELSHRVLPAWLQALARGPEPG